jgi:phosphopantetheinyl transferase
MKQQEHQQAAQQERLAHECPRHQQLYDAALVWLGQGLVTAGEWLQRLSERSRDKTAQPRLQRQP